MIKMNLDELIKKIADESGVSIAEIHRMIEAKKEELDNFVNDTAAAHLIARELEVDIEYTPSKQPQDDKTLNDMTIKKLKQMPVGVGSVSLTGVIMRVYSPIEFMRGNVKGILVRLDFHDETDSIKLVLWGNNALNITNKVIKRGDIITIKNGYTKESREKSLEVHLGDRSSIEKHDNKEEFNEKNYPDPENDLMDLNKIEGGMRDLDFKATVTSTSTNLINFNRKDGSEGKVANLLIEGNNVKRRLVFWNEQAEKAFNFTVGDIILIEGANSNINRDGNVEMHVNRFTNISKIGKNSTLKVQKGIESTSSVKSIIDLSENDDSVSLIVRIGEKNAVKTFNRKDESKGSVQRCIIYDNSSAVPLVLWDDSINRLSEVKSEPVLMKNLRTKMNQYGSIEVHSTQTTDILPEGKDTVDKENLYTNISEIENHKEFLASVQGIVREFSETREFTRSNESTGRVKNCVLQDSTGTTRIVAWGDQVEKLEAIEEKDEKFCKFKFLRVREQQDRYELHLFFSSQLESTNEIPEEFTKLEYDSPEQKREKVTYDSVNIVSAELDQSVELLGRFILTQNQQPYYYACPECQKATRDNACNTHGEVEPILKLRLSGTIEDGSGNIRCVLFGKQAEIISTLKTTQVNEKINNNLSNEEILNELKDLIEKKYFVFKGKIEARERTIEGEVKEFQEMRIHFIDTQSPEQKTLDMINEIKNQV